MTKLTVLFVCAMLAACSIQRAQNAQVAKTQLVGMSKEQILACMGPPIQKAAEGSTEVWSYGSGNDRTTVYASGSSTTSATVTGNSNYATGRANTYGSEIATSTRRHCTVNIVMVGGRVSSVNYLGPTGGLLTQGEQCVFAVESCLR